MNITQTNPKNNEHQTNNKTKSTYKTKPKNNKQKN